jgi:sensor histidine kinase YesM
MYLAELRASGRKALAISGGCALISSLVDAWSIGWRTLIAVLRYNLIFAAFIGLLFWLSAPLITAHAGRMSPKWQWAFRIVSWTVVMNAGVLLALAVVVTMGVFPAERYASEFRQAFLPATLFGTICGTAYTIHEGLKYRSQYAVTQARLTSLEARLRPHFLFNALNSIVALIPEDPASAERLTMKLSDLLRYSLDSEHRSTVLLRQELSVTGDYLEIEKTRSGGHLRYCVDVPSELLAMQVPPFCLQTLVENSVKYGGGEIRIRARASGGRLLLRVWDSGEGFGGKQHEIPGHGLHDLRQRLAALWGGRSALEYPESVAGTAVEISIPCRASE